MSNDSEPWMRTRVATFEPKRRDNLRSEAVGFIGQTLRWRGLWVVTDEDGGPYVGQVVWEPGDRSLWFGWVPDEDLVAA